MSDATGPTGSPDRGIQDVDQLVLPVVTEAGMARHLSQSGRRCVVHRDRHWVQVVPGFYRPVHLLARLSARAATRPVTACWGWQACLTDQDAGHADGALPTHLLADLDGFDERALRPNRRSQLRKVRRLTRMVGLTGPALLREQGYRVLRSAHARTGYGRLPREQEYLAELERLGDPAYGVVLAGLVDGRLGGYVTGHAVDGTAYVRETVIATDAMRTGLGVGLTYEFLALCRRTAGVREVVHGMHARENASLCSYKAEFGLPVRRVPARVWLLPGTGAIIRSRDAHKYYRLTGRG